MIKKDNFFLLTFDLEEFDLPLEYNIKIDEKDIYEISYKGAIKIIEILNKYDICATFFVTGKFALKFPDIIKTIYEKGHEIGSHSYSHSDNYLSKNNPKNNIEEGKKILEKIIKNKIIGFRSPRLQKPPYKILRELKFEYDNSLHPTYIPGRYNNILSKRNLFFHNNIFEIPISVTPLTRFPFSWLWFRNFGVRYARVCTDLCLYNPGFVNTYFHPWEFIDIKKYNLHYFLCFRTGKWMEKKFQDYLKWCLNKKIRFCTVKDYILHIKN